MRAARSNDRCGSLFATIEELSQKRNGKNTEIWCTQASLFLFVYQFNILTANNSIVYVECEGF
jgi:hypothetical protein